MVEYAPAAGFVPSEVGETEWGFVWERLDDTMGQPRKPPILSWDDFRSYEPPDPNAKGRFDHIEDFIRCKSGKYLLGTMGITGFNLVTFMRGFESALVDLYVNRDSIETLIDMVFSFEKEIIRNYGRYGLDAVAFFDDWGTQDRLMISPTLWREVFKSRYKEQFDLVHEFGMHVYSHSCGFIYDIIPTSSRSVDVLNLNQPDLFGIERLVRSLAEECVQLSVDHQTVAINGTRGEIFEYVERLNRHLEATMGAS